VHTDRDDMPGTLKAALPTRGLRDGPSQAVANQDHAVWGAAPGLFQHHLCPRGSGAVNSDSITSLRTAHERFLGVLENAICGY
jgi:hypothetical protein